MKDQPQTANNHKVGDTVIIRNNFYEHGYDIGTKVTILTVNEEDKDYKVQDQNGRVRWCADANFLTKKQLDKL